MNGRQPALPSQPESPGTHLYIPGVSHLVTSLRNIAEEKRKQCQGESQVQQSKELQPPSRPPHQSQVEMSEIAKIQSVKLRESGDPTRMFQSSLPLQMRKLKPKSQSETE